MAKNLDKKLLEGLAFSGAEAKKDEKTGKKIFKPFTRPLTEDDVTSFIDKGKSVIITTADGKKYNVPKKGAAPAAGNDGKTE